MVQDHTRVFQDLIYVYPVISRRSRGLSIGVNLNPDKRCNFDCVYCEVDRRTPGRAESVNLGQLREELSWLIRYAQDGGLATQPKFDQVPELTRVVRDIAFSGDGEPTLCPQIVEVIHTVLHVRARSGLPFFKIALITNATGLDRPAVAEGLRCLTGRDEVWAKLDAGTQAWMERINRPTVLLAKVLANILAVARQRPVVIQSLFPALNGQEPPELEIREYAQRLKELKDAGANIPLVQIYSATRPTPHSECGHLPLRSLARIAQTVRDTTGLRAEVF